MVTLFSGALVFASGIIAIVVTIFVIEVVAAVLRRSRTSVRGESDTTPVSTAVLIPAHNECGAIQRTLEDVRAQLLPGDRVLVVADNCEDDTAIAARDAGGEVVERRDEARRGKGYALDFGIRHLASNPPEVVIIIDADCRLAANVIESLARGCASTQRPMQALDLMVAPQGAASDQRFAEFAWRIKNWVRPLGLHALGLPCQLMGTGMAFPWTLIRRAELATGHIVEDLKLGLELAGIGAAPVFCPAAVVTSEFPTTERGTETQRRRWEGGHLQTIAADALPLIWRALRSGNRDLLVLALDLAVPPLTFLALLVMSTVVLAAAAYTLGLSSAPLIISTATLLTFLVAVAVCWFRVGRDLLPPRAIVALGPVLIGKLRLYGRVLGGRTPTEWERTERKPGDTSP